MGSVRRRNNQQYLIYLGLNVIVSAVTTLVVIAIFGRGQRAEPVIPTPTVDLVAQVAQALPTETPAPEPTPTPFLYLVRSGDTLYEIARSFGISVEDLMAANDLEDANDLDVGQELEIPGGELVIQATEAAAQVEPLATIPGPTFQVLIAAVEGAGDLSRELIRLENVDGQVSMQGWTLLDGNREVYRFPDFTFYSRGAVEIHTVEGSDSPVELHIGSNSALWEPGTEIRLLDADGTVQSVFQIPDN